MKRLASPRLYLDYLDPFNCECRAYGRLRDENCEHLTVRAHGYLLLSPDQEAEITTLAGEVESDEDTLTPAEGMGAFGRWEEHRGIPVRAIVKDIAPEDKPWVPEQQRALWRDLEDLHALGIVVGDINVFNYVGGKLVDLGHSWTMPHPCLDAVSKSTLANIKQSDALELDCALVDWGLGKGWSQEELDLRPEELKKCAGGEGEGEGKPFGTDPLLYDWLKWESDLAAVKQFWLHELCAQPAERRQEPGATLEQGREGRTQAAVGPATESGDE